MTPAKAEIAQAETTPEASQSGTSAPGATRPIPTVAELFTGFFQAGVSGFGGVLPFARRMIVDERRWLTAEEFTDMWSLCQFLPGPNIVNMSIALGLRYRGLSGAVAGALGLLGAPFFIMVAVGALYTRFGAEPHVKSVLAGISAVAAGLLLAMALKMANTPRVRSWMAVFSVLAFTAIAIARLPLASVLAVLAPLSIVAAWLRMRRTLTGAQPNGGGR
jgi:chromate transporter